MFASIRRSISRKFMTAVMATTFVAVVVSGVANLAYDVHDYRAGAEQGMHSQADLLARVSVAALEFDDQHSVQDTLAQLRTRPDILAAAIYRADGRLFAAYAAPGQTVPARPFPTGSEIAGNDLEIGKPIARGREKLGSIYLHATYPLQERLQRNIRILVGVTLASLLIAALVSLWLQAAVTRPVRAVTAAVRDLIARRDYSQRVARTTEDETGALVDAFNTMLGEIGAHAALLEQSNASLQHEVAERTRADRALQELNASLEARIAARSLELEQAHEQLRHAQKMEAIGQLTGGVAHDFNNVLHVISGNLQLLAMTLADNPDAWRRIDTARFATERGAKLSSQLLSFARRQPLKPSPTNLGRVLRAMDDMLRRALGETVAIETVVAPGLWNTLVDPHQLENVILNLAINARDAMQGEGRLTLELGNATLDQAYVAAEPDLEPGPYVMLAIGDTGSGMSPEVMARAFEPFFTTKREGEGTGLGLSMAFGFAKQSHGHICLESEVGRGTTIRIYLPRSDADEEQVFDMSSGEVLGGTETILIAEDDLAVQATAVDTLTQLGYRVLRANDGQSALEVLQGGAAVDLLFTDVVMPGSLRSPDLARLAREMFPSISVLFTSGYTQDAIMHGGRLDPGVELISKPYRREDLARKVRHMLNNARQATGMRGEQQALAAQAVPAVQAPAAAAPGQRILVVEDNADNCALLDELLSMLGHDVVATPHAEAALQAYAPDRFDVLLTDLHLPGISGLALAGQLRARQPGLRVVVASGMALAAGEMAASGYHTLLKPYRIEQLAAALG